MGSRFWGGRHLRTLVMNTDSRERPIWTSSVSSSLPAAPTKGLPCMSSLKPGASPTIITSAGQGPVPGTACVRVAWSPHWVQARICALSRSRVGSSLSDFHSRRWKADQVARVLDHLHHFLEVLGGHRRQRQPEGSGGEPELVQHRLDGDGVAGGRHERL